MPAASSIPAELDKELRNDVRVLGDLLGEVLRTQAGPEVYETVERIRKWQPGSRIRVEFVRLFIDRVRGSLSPLRHH